MAKKVNGLTTSNAVPDIIIGGDSGANSFRTFTKTILTAFINGLISASINGITLTGITGSTITNAALAGRNILLITIDDTTYNLGFAKPGGNATEKKAANSVVFADIAIRPDQTVTIIFE
jgi:predicted Zn-dependent protease